MLAITIIPVESQKANNYIIKTISKQFKKKCVSYTNLTKLSYKSLNNTKSSEFSRTHVSELIKTHKLIHIHVSCPYKFKKTQNHVSFQEFA